MDLKYLIAQQRRRPKSPSLDFSFALDESNKSRRGIDSTFTRTSSGTFTNKNGVIVGKTTSTTSYNTANVKIDDIITFTIPSGSVVGWSDDAEVAAHNDVNADNQVPGDGNTTETVIRGTIIHKGETTISLKVFGKGGPDATVSAWSISYRGPRLDYNPLTGVCRGLLIEETKINLVAYSSELYNGYWTRGGIPVNGSVATVTSTTEIAPDGTPTANRIVYTGANQDVYRDVTTSVGQYTGSFYVKAGDPSEVGKTIAIGVGGPNYQDEYFTLTNSWQRISATKITQQPPAGSPKCRIAVHTWGLNTTARNILVWGAQLETGSRPTSYIPTKTVTATRSVDVCDITGDNFSRFYNQNVGTFYTESRPQTVDGTTTIFGVSNGTTNERWLNRFAQNEQVVINSSGTESKFDPLNPVAGAFYKVATAATVNDIAMSINGITTLTDTSQPMPTVDRATIGSVSSIVAAIRYYPYRLSDAKLQELTETTTQTLTYNGSPLLFNNTDIDITI